MKIYNPPPCIQVLLTVLTITAGVAISSWGEMHFVLIGFVIQGTAVVFEAYKNALQQFLLSGKTQMSSMTLLYYFSPACTLINLFWIIAFEMEPLQLRGGLGLNPWVFLANGALCFALNIASVTVVRIVMTISRSHH